MKYFKPGICCGADLFGPASECGFEYAEVAAWSIRGLDDAALKEMRCKAEGCGLTIDGMNCFFNGEVSLYRDDDEKILKYAASNFEIANILGAGFCVIGNGAARSVPSGMERKKAEERFSSLVGKIGDLAKTYGVEIIIEPLCRAETDLINTVTEGAEFCRGVNNENVGFLVDFYHFFVNGEELSEFDGLDTKKLRHVHFARPNADRGLPAKEDEKIMSAWFKKLKDSGYSGRLSLECRVGTDFAENLPRSAALIDELIRI